MKSSFLTHKKHKADFKCFDMRTNCPVAALNNDCVFHVNFIPIFSSSFSSFQPKSKAGLLSLRMFSEATKFTEIYDKYGVTNYLMGAGLSVAPAYRSLGVAVELLKARYFVKWKFNKEIC